MPISPGTGPICPESDSHLSRNAADLPRKRLRSFRIRTSQKNGADLSRIRFRSSLVPIFPESDSDLSRTRTDLSRIRFRPLQIPRSENQISIFPKMGLIRPQGDSEQRQIPISPKTGPTCPESDSGASNFRCSATRYRSLRKRGRSVQKTISISPGSDLSSIRFRSLQKQDRSVQNQIPILPETGPTCQGSDSGLSKSQFPRISSRSF